MVVSDNGTNSNLYPWSTELEEGKGSGRGREEGCKTGRPLLSTPENEYLEFCFLLGEPPHIPVKLSSPGLDVRELLAE
jgi:hypothetical protein